MTAPTPRSAPFLPVLGVFHAPLGASDTPQTRNLLSEETL
jgi:hypothetical protein